MTSAQHGTESPVERRGFLRTFGSWFMGLGLFSSYGFFATLMGRYMLPTREAPRAQLYVANLDRVAVGDSISYLSPVGQQVLITRIAEQGDVGDFIALSSICPHLGCQVHWEAQNDRFFCPCHNGGFDAEGKPTEGPPKDANQSLARYPLIVENGILFIDVETTRLVAQDETSAASQEV